MTRPTSTTIARPLHELLELDPSLSSTDAKVLETLLLDPHTATAREISRATHTNLQSLYGALDRLVGRGLVAKTRGSAAMTFRAANPRVILNELLAPFERARELVAELEEPLRTLYESGEIGGAAHPPAESMSTGSRAAASSWLLDRLSGAAEEVWFLGSETLWFGQSPALESELEARLHNGRRLGVRLLVQAPGPDDPRLRHHVRLRRSGVEVRYSPRFSAPAVIVDRRWILLRSAAAVPTQRTPGSYYRLETPELCSDLADAAEEEWQRLAGARAPEERGAVSASSGNSSGGPAGARLRR
jgi:hypothetical protein